MQNRYDQVVNEAKSKNPGVIVEIGTWNGEMALRLCEACPGAEYWGFDLFEDATEETDAREFNVKSRHYMAEVEKKLNCIDNRTTLVRGDTRSMLSRVTLPPIDFLFIDGGHSEQTIRSDWANLKGKLSPVGVVIFDDYYDPEKEGFGCNKVIQDLKHEFMEVVGVTFNNVKVKMVKVNASEI